jgi:hypothetical protein
MPPCCRIGSSPAENSFGRITSDDLIARSPGRSRVQNGEGLLRPHVAPAAGGLAPDRGVEEMTATPPEHGRPVPNADSRPSSQARSDPPVPPKPNIHVTALIVWLTIFPLVAIFSTLLGPMTMDWHPVLRAFVLTLIVVPIAAYWLMPQMFRWYGALARRRASRRARKPVQ